ncbi:helix-turn-helix domain-containing protein [Streptomyces parvulus]|uniref:IclR family transcriptional regulator domain-containing protein n=1 Tax=Streptomyces parvulus TaxID=146923 RepID=UPI00210A3096|nr:IclR family transcriptional regulator C-terminal domain-containing protein [Streptomyces parvulus]MCQ4192444.1 helix-turn-helix domain-containing protein [Streptomyces parvulus]
MPANTTNAAARDGAAVPDGPAAVPDEAVAPLLRGITVLRRLTEADGGALSLSALERATGLARSTVDRLVATLARMDYVRLDGRDVHLAPRLMELGNAYLAALRLPALLAGRADALADELDESVSLAVGDRDGIRFIHQATRRRAMSLSFRIGDLLPAERTAPGPLFAAGWTPADWHRWHERRTADPRDDRFPALPPREHASADAEFERRAARAALDGWALDDQLIEPGLVAISVPVRAPGTGWARGTGWAADTGWTVGAGEVAGAGDVAGARDMAGAGDVEGAADVAGAREMAGAGDVARAREAAGAGDMAGAGEVVCVASVVSHTSRHTAPDLRSALLPRLRAAVAAMEDDLRTAPPAQPGPPPAGLAVWTGASKQELGREFVESLARGLTVLTAFGEGRAALTLTEIARATGLTRASARRALITHEHAGLVAPAPDRTYALTPRVLSLGIPPLSRTSLPEIAQPHLTALAGRVHESAALAVLSDTGDEIQYTARAAGGRVLSARVTVGTRLPAHATALGRVLLADRPDATASPVLRRVREEGHALVDEELEAGLRAVAVPVRDRAGRVVAAVNIAMHAARGTTEECLTRVLPELRHTADLVEAELRVAGRFCRVAVV